jgi:hypothetical protein
MLHDSAQLLVKQARLIERQFKRNPLANQAGTRVREFEFVFAQLGQQLVASRFR